ncbi:uncharacterized protein [Primulina eburnea]|uniref:uncharacterized protein n=1 Tax=Primulina eburnea TaxID=1245227 RepID=UPI003C6C1CC0
MDFKDSWQEALPLVEFSYNNNFQVTIGMAPFEALYGRRCRSPLCWDEFGEKQLTGPEIVQEMHDKVQLIHQRMKAAQDRQASYANRRRRPLEFQVGDFVFQRISPFRGVVRFGMRGKLSPRFSLFGIHDVFHVSMLPKYELDPSHVIQPDEVELDPSLSYTEYPVCILDRKDKVLRNKVIPLKIRKDRGNIFLSMKIPVVVIRYKSITTEMYLHSIFI